MRQDGRWAGPGGAVIRVRGFFFDARTRPGMSTIDLLRHGEPDGGLCYRGDGVDDPLSERGWAEMWAAVGEFSDWTHVISSPLERCRGFAKAVAERSEYVVDILAVPEGGKVRLHSGKRYLNLRAADLNAYEGERGRRGSKLPRGFQRVDGIELDN